MAILPSESGLSQADYEALQQMQDAYTHRITAERQNLVFDLFSTTPSATSTTIDAIVFDGYLFRCATNVIIRTTLADGTETAITPATPTGWIPQASYSLAANASVLYVFSASATGVQMNSTSNYGSSWAGWTTIWSTTNQTIYTGDVARDGTATASSTYTSSTATYPASNAFDHLAITEWITPIGTTTGTLQYNFALAATKTVTRYKITAGGTMAPKNWTFQGSHNGSSWTTLDTITNSTGWAQPETRTFTCVNTTGYEYYRLNITANNTSTQLAIFEFTLHETSTDEAVILVAAATYQRVHFIYVDGANKLYYPSVVEYIGGVWTMTSSSYALTERLQKFTVANIGTTDFLLVETNIAGRVVDTLTDSTLTSERKKSGGLIVFHYKTDAVIWSTHYPVDIIDELSSVDYMRYSHIKNLNGTLHVTAFVGSGTVSHPIQGLYNYTSKDGIHWSTRSRMYLDGTQVFGAIILQSGEYAYVVEGDRVWRSLSTRFTGYTAVSLTEDITNYISEWSLSQNDLAQITLLLDNADGYFDNHPFISGTNQVLFTLEFGSFVEGDELLYQLGLFEMDDFAIGETVPEHMIQISARDYMARMVDKVNASEFRSYDSYLLGMDSYSDKDNGGYGALTHVYTVSGQIEVIGSPALFVAVMWNGEGIGFSTFVEDLWNGEISCGIHAAAAGAKAGLIFRGKTANNFWAFVYDYSSDKVKLFNVNSNQNASGLNSGNELYASSALGWTATIPSVYKWLRVRFLYGEIKCYTSTDGITWTLMTTYVMDCSNKTDYNTTSFSDPVTDLDPCERGSVGIYGFGDKSLTGYGVVRDFRVNDFTLPLTVEDAFSSYASFARIHDKEFETLLKPGDDMWVSGTGVTVDTGMATGYYSEDVYDGALYG